MGVSFKVEGEMMPVGIQQKRVSGWRMPEGAKSVARPGIFGNPFMVTPEHSAAECVQEFETWLETGKLPFGLTYKEVEALGRRRTEVLRRLPELRGMDLACFCALDSPCHRNPLIRIVRKLTS